MKTNIEGGERVWTKQSILTILECAYPQHSNRTPEERFVSLKEVLNDGLIECGFNAHSFGFEKMHTQWWITHENWKCQILLHELDDFKPQIIFEVKEELCVRSYLDIEDLLHLWGKIRSFWGDRRTLLKT